MNNPTSTTWSIHVIASGSKANCALVRTPQALILIDAGISLRALNKVLRADGHTMADIAGVLLTHEHKDHTAHLPNWLDKFPDLAVHATPGTIDGFAARFQGVRPANLHALVPGTATRIADLSIDVIRTHHDANDPVAFGLQCGSSIAAWITDTGRTTEHMHDIVRQSHHVFAESNHDPALLEHGPYPDFLKRRVGGPNGHLSNGQCADLLERSGTGAGSVTLLHRSEHNNTDKLAMAASRRVLGETTTIELAHQRIPLHPRLIAATAQSANGQTLLPL
jgi:phosphoribosyl 1,2-cyclic phosphodiesterase